MAIPWTIFIKPDDLREKIETSQNREGMLEELHAQEKTLFVSANHLADEISWWKKKGAEAFELKIKEQLNDLYLSHAVFKADFLDCELNSLGSGLNHLQSRNECRTALTPLNESASGGEISRLMLAIKTISLQNSDVDTIVFDEVDTGVSGKVADAIGGENVLIGQLQTSYLHHASPTSSCSCANSLCNHEGKWWSPDLYKHPLRWKRRTCTRSC